MSSEQNKSNEASGLPLGHDEILTLRDTAVTAAAVAHLAASRLHALLTSDTSEPGVDLAWFDVGGERPGTPEERLAGMARYVHARGVTNPEQLYLHDGGRDWAGQSAPYRQALELFCHVVLTTAAGMERRKGELARLRRLEAETASARPLRIEDSIFEPEAAMGEMLPHAVEALSRPPEPVDRKPVDGKPGDRKPLGGDGQASEPIDAMSVGEPPVGLKPVKPAKAKNSR